MKKRAVVFLNIVFFFYAVTAFAEIFSILDEKGNPTEELIEALLSPSEFKGRVFEWKSYDEEAQFCLDASLGSKEPFAQVYPERIVWPQVGGIDLKVEKLNLKLIPAISKLSDELLDHGFGIRWKLEALGQDFSKSALFRMRVIGAQVFSTLDQRVLLKWEEAAMPDICVKDPSQYYPNCIYSGIGLETTTVAISPEGKYIAVGVAGLKPRIEVFSLLPSLKRKWQIFFSHDSGGVSKVVFTADGKNLVALLDNGEIHRFDAVSGGGYKNIPSRGTAVASIWPGQVVAAAEESGKITLWRLSDSTIDWIIPPRRSRGIVRGILASPDGTLIATYEYAKTDFIIRVWKIGIPLALGQFTINSRRIVDVHFSKNGNDLLFSDAQSGLYKLDLKKNGIQTSLGGDAKTCRGEFVLLSSGWVACSLGSSIIILSEDGRRLNTLKTAEKSGRWIVDAALNGTIVAAGAGHLLVWQNTRKKNENDSK